MQLLDHLRRQFAYDTWANREVLTTLKKSSSASSRPRLLLAHILSAERLWLERIQGGPQSLPVWPEFSFEQCEAQITELKSLWRTFLIELSPGGLSNEITYKNSKGEAWTNTIEDILTHVLLHSMRPATHDTAQVPAEQTLPEGQTLPQAPQLLMSV